MGPTGQATGAENTSNKCSFLKIQDLIVPPRRSARKNGMTELVGWQLEFQELVVKKLCRDAVEDVKNQQPEH